MRFDLCRLYPRVAASSAVLIRLFSNGLTHFSGAGFAVVAGRRCRYNSAVTATFVVKELPGECAMDHELREKGQDLITRIKHLQDSL